VNIVAGSLKRSAEEGAHRALAVGPCDMDCRRKPVLGPAKAIKQVLYPVEAELVEAW
jgi:hypothetical protein